MIMPGKEFTARRGCPARLYVAVFAVFALVGLSGVFAVESDGRPQTALGRWFGGCMFTVCTALAVRGSRAGEVAPRGGQLRIRTLVRTHRFAISQVEGVSARESSLGALGYRRDVLYVTLRDGRCVRIDDVNGPARGRGAGQVPAMVRRLDECLRTAQAVVHGSTASR